MSGRRVRSARGVRVLGGTAMLSALALGLLPTPSAVAAPALDFTVQTRGFTIQSSTTGGGANANPSSGFTIAKATSLPKLGGGRTLQLNSVASTNNPGDLGGAALFTPDAATGPGTSNFPLFSEAFFPAEASAGQAEKSEKCGANPQSTPNDACRQQPGPYALAEVKGDESAPVSLGNARNGGGQPGQGETESTSQVKVDGDTVVGTNVNIGRQSGVPGTPIMVDSFRAESTVKTTRQGTSATGSCTADVRVGPTPITTPEQLSTVLALAAPAIKVEYIPPTKATPKVLEAGAVDGIEISCTGAQFTVTQGDVSTVYTYGSTFGTAGPQLEGEAISLTGGPEATEVLDSGIVSTDTGAPPAATSDPGVVGEPSATLEVAIGVAPVDAGFVPSTPALPDVGAGVTSGAGTASIPSDVPSSVSASAPAPVLSGIPAPASSPLPAAAPAPAAPAPASAPAAIEAPATIPADQFGGELVERGINLARIAAGTTLAASLLPLAAWMLMGVVGSLARGTSLRLPPFRPGGGRDGLTPAG